METKKQEEYICSECGEMMQQFYAVALDEKGMTYRCRGCMDKKTEEYFARKNFCMSRDARDAKDLDSTV